MCTGFHLLMITPIYVYMCVYDEHGNKYVYQKNIYQAVVIGSLEEREKRNREISGGEDWNSFFFFYVSAACMV